MEPVSLILAAIVAGVSDVAKDTATDAVKDAYAGLKGLLKRRFGGEAKAETALDAFEQDQDTWEKPLAKSLQESGATADDEVLALAKRVLELAQSGPAAASKYQVDVRGGTGVAVGDYSTVHQNITRE